MESKIEILLPHGWDDLKKFVKYGEFGGITYESNMEIADSSYGGESVVIQEPQITSASFTLQLQVTNDDDPEKANILDGLMTQATALRINGYISRARIKKDSDEYYKRQINGPKGMSYTVTMLDPFFWDEPRVLIGDAPIFPMRMASEEPTVNEEPFVVKGPGRWRLTIQGRPSAIVVQAVRVTGSSSRQAYVFSATNIELNDGFDFIVIDNFALSEGDLRLFQASKATGEVQDLSNYIDTGGNGYFNLDYGRYAINVYIYGRYDQYVLEMYEGKRYPSERVK